jgi:hypothetical protein
VTVIYKIAHSDADFMVEDPAMNAAGQLAPFASWGAVQLSNAEVRVGGRWLPAGALQISMVQHGKTTASAGPLGDGGTSFTATQS